MIKTFILNEIIMKMQLHVKKLKAREGLQNDKTIIESIHRIYFIKNDLNRHC